jgi:transposase
MSSVTVYVGLDYHQSAVQVCVMDASGKVLLNRRCPNCWRTITAVVHRHSRCVQAAIEACSGAAELADELVQQGGWSVNLAHPGYVARLKQSPDKTDFGDARLLADLERVGYLPRVWLAPEPVRELRRLVRFRQQLAQQRRNTKLRIRALLRDLRLVVPAGRSAWTRSWIEWLKRTDAFGHQTRWIMDQHLGELQRLDREIRQAEKLLTSTIKDDQLVQRLMQTPGIGLVTAVTLRAEIGRFDRFRSGKQLARFCGLSPRNASSGQRQADAGLIKAGNPQLRAVLMEAAHRLMRYEDRWIALGHSLRRQGKPNSLVVAAIANRWIRWLYHQVPAYELAA